MSANYLLVYCTCPDKHSAERLARCLVAERMAACVNLIPGLRSIYQWKGEIEVSEEVLLLIKTRSNTYEALQQCIKENHPYELPEIIAVPCERGLPEYLQWIDSCL